MATGEACAVVKDPRALLEQQVVTITERLRNNPTLPAKKENPIACKNTVLTNTSATLLPAKHCAFAGCNWTLEWNEEVNKMSELCRGKMMLRHLREKHKASFHASLLYWFDGRIMCAETKNTRITF